MNRHVLRAVSLLLLAVAVTAETHPNLERGFAADKLYQLSDIEQVNLFNGNVSVTIPIGPTYPVSDRLSYGLRLTYNSKAWDIKKFYVSANYTGSRKEPSSDSNAGLGWSLTLGRLISPAEAEFGENPAWIYVAPDASRHRFYDTLHLAAREAPVAGVAYTRDGTYLRLQASGSNYLVEEPSGTINEFEPWTDTSGPAPTQRYRLRQVRDRFSNTFDVGYAVANEWRVTDQYGRLTRIIFAPNAADPESRYPNYARLLSAVEFQTFDGGTATYTFQYEQRWVRRAYCGEDQRDNVGDPDNPDDDDPRFVYVPVLSKLLLPDGSSYELDYYYPGSPDDPMDPLTEASCHAGSIKSLVLPTKGSVHWTYGMYEMPSKGCPDDDPDPADDTSGVYSRTYRSPRNGVPDAVWKYKPTLTYEGFGTYRCGGKDDATTDFPFEEMKNTVTAPDLNETVHYFSVYPLNFPVNNTLNSWRNFGLPFSTKRASGGKFISTEVCSGSCANAVNVRRTTYVRYELDHGSQRFDANRRLKGSRTEFLDDPTPDEDLGDGIAPPPHFVDSDSYDYDGLGHYRINIQASSFPGTPTRKATTAFNKRDTTVNAQQFDSGTYESTFTAGTFNLPAKATPWVLNLYPSQEVLEDGARGTTVKQQYCSENTGFLRGTRKLRGAASSIYDLVTTYETHPSNAPPDRSTDMAGAVLKETMYGGDATPLFATAIDSTVSLCTLVAAPGNAAYQLRHTYTFGLRATSEYFANDVGAGFKILNRSIHANTGLVAGETDSAGLTTTFDYDSMGRSEYVYAPGQDAVSYTYTNATSAVDAKLKISRGAGVTESAVEYHFDHLGRPRIERRLMPGGTWARRETKYDSMGRRSDVSEWDADTVAPSRWTTYRSIDPFGRVGTITMPDGEARYFAYTGTRKIERSVAIATTASGAEAYATTTEEYDGYGRLRTIVEPNTSTTTTYTYDVGGRLSDVAMSDGANTQVRTFDYDFAGFLLREQHPEIGTAGGGVVSYPCYDAAGHALRRVDGVAVTGPACQPSAEANAFDVRFTFDSAARLSNVRRSGTNGALLKEFTYGTGTSDDDRSLGKLKTAVRHNYHPVSNADVRVTETYVYGDTAGRLTQRVTAITDGMTSASPEFSQTYHYDAHGLPDIIGYPDCTNGQCGVSVARTVTFGRDRGYLKTVEGFTGHASTSDHITYWPSGMVQKVVHADGSIDTVGRSPTNGMARPDSITFSNWLTTPPCDAVTLSGPSPATQTIPYRGGTTISVTAAGGTGHTFRWYEGPRLDTTREVGQSSTLTVGPLTQNATYWVRVTNACGSFVESAEAKVFVQLATPTAVTASMMSSGRIRVAWSPVDGATMYHVQRSANGVNFTTVRPNEPTTTWFDETAAAWTSYLYRVTATGPNVADSAPSAADVATRVAFTNDDITPGDIIRGNQIGELRRAVDAVRRLAGLPSMWANYNAPTGFVRAAHFVEIRSALEQARTVLTQMAGVSMPNLGDPVVAGAPIRAIDLQRLMEGMK